MSKVDELHTARDVVGSHALDVLVVGLVGSMSERVDGSDDLRGVPCLRETVEFDIRVLDCVVKYRDDLVGRIRKREHDPQRMEDVGLGFGGRVPLPAMSSSSQR